MPEKPSTRRDFVAAMGIGIVGVAGIGPANRRLHCPHGDPRAEGPHPDPRPDVDASNVLSRAELQSAPHVIDIYDGIREIPHIADGVRCQCGCADLPGYRSLLTCFESEGMAMWCEVCQTEGRMVYRLHQSGRTLDQIRAAVDARFG